MKEPVGRLTTASTVLVGLLAFWTGYRLSVSIPAISQLLAGLGSEIPFVTRTVVAIPGTAFLFLGLIAGVLIVVKDYYLENERTRLQVNLLAAISCFFFYMFCHSAMMQPMIELVRRIG